MKPVSQIRKKLVVELFKKRAVVYNGEGMARVAILTSKTKTGVIDNASFIPRSGWRDGCEWFPGMDAVASTLCRVVREKKVIRGLVLLHGLHYTDSLAYSTMSTYFKTMVRGGWANKSFVYLICGSNELFAWRLIDGAGYKYSEVKLKYV